MKTKNQNIKLSAIFIAVILNILCFEGNSQETKSLLPVNYLTEQKNPADFVLSNSGKSAPLVLDAYDYPGVIKIAGYFQDDIYKVTGAKPHIIMGEMPNDKEIVIIGTIGKSSLIDSLISWKKINVDDIKDKWETSLIQVVENPFPNIEKALVIAGSDKRGTIFGMFDISRQIGVSPWYFWADVPVQHKDAITIKAGRYNLGTPKVKYRGIFLNDEEPALGRWAVENYGGFNHLFYEKVFELILRLKGNYLWPAMWWAAFNANDPQNPELADEMGIVMGTTHHEPMNRAQKEWAPYGGKAWNYETNAEQLREFWRGGIERIGDRETIVNLAMRGDGDMAMSRETNTALLEKIVADQREIIKEVTKKDITETPQLWALYKEVQDYYDKGMRVPDDVTLLLCDDNWGNIRKLPRPSDPPRAGGYGIYYHFDYVGGPRNYKWLNTNPLPRIWEQMNLAYQHGVDRIWIVNVGDLKPMEVPISFFLDFAFDPDAWPAERLKEYTELWAKEQFGNAHSSEIAEMLRLYAKYNGRRKPELLSPDTYSLLNFREAETIRDEYNQLAEKAQKLNNEIPAKQKDAYYELVLHPISACANLNDLYVTTALNKMYAEQGRSSTNDLAQKVKELFKKDSLITDYYHNALADGKWNHMMSQTHIGYTYWQQPPKNRIPKTETTEIPEHSEMAVAIEGSEKFWTEGDVDVPLPVLDPFNQTSVFIDVFNRGQKPFDLYIQNDADWITLSEKSGEVDDEKRIWITVDWNKAPAGKTSSLLIVKGNGKTVNLNIDINNLNGIKNQIRNTFVESNGMVSMEAEHFSRKTESRGITWKIIPGLGRTLSGVTVNPVTADSIVPGGNNPRLEYDIYLQEPGDAEITVLLSPTLNYFNDDGRKLAVSVDDEKPQIINAHENYSSRLWERWVSNNIIEAVSTHPFESAGKHTIKVWMVDSGLVLQKIVVSTGEKKDSYLGPPESYFAD